VVKVKKFDEKKGRKDFSQITPAEKEKIKDQHVLVISKLLKSKGWDETMKSIELQFSKFGKIVNIKLPRQVDGDKSERR
jgi:tRNA G37 N-methylase Trm5